MWGPQNDNICSQAEVLQQHLLKYTLPYGSDSLEIAFCKIRNCVLTTKFLSFHILVYGLFFYKLGQARNRN